MCVFSQDASYNPLVLSKLLRLEWVFVHISGWCENGSSFEPLIAIQNRSIYQDRLGTNIGETQKRLPFCATALSPSTEEVLTAEGIFPRSVELRYTLAEEPRGGGGDAAAAAASTAPPQAHRPPHRAGGGSAPPQSQPAASVNLRMRERFGSGRWGWAEGRHIAVDVDPALARLKIRSVEVRG